MAVPTVSVLNTCSFCPLLFTDKDKLVIHKQKEHGIHDKLIEVVQLGIKDNFQISVRNAGAMIMQECYGCGSTVPLSNFAEHQKRHIDQKITRKVNMTVPKDKVEGRAPKKPRTEDKDTVIITLPNDKSL